jgi:nucleoside-diphosphate-sugar epimerase
VRRNRLSTAGIKHAEDIVIRPIARRVKGETVLITGGAGFIGANIARWLVDQNQVVLLDNLHRNSLADDEKLADHPNLTLIQGDVLDQHAVNRAIRGATVLIHCAAIAGVDTVLAHPTKTMRVNIIGTYNVLEAAVAAGGIKRFIDFSTSEVFGAYAYKVQEGDTTTLGAVGEARWTYAVSKLATEHMAHTYYREFGLPTVAIRPFNIYGPGQVGEGAIHHFIVRALKGEDIAIHNDGSQIRAWCYIDDIVDAVVRAIDFDKAVGHSFNVGNPRSTLTIYNLAREIHRLVKSESDINFVTWDHPDVELRIPDVTKARRLLGFEPAVDLEDGLKKTIAWYREKHK